MISNFKNLVFILTITSSLLFCVNNVSYAQGESPDTNANSEESKAEEPQEEKFKSSTAYKVLGRDFTSREREIYSSLKESEIKDHLLSREQRLVAVRALLAVGENDMELLKVLPQDKSRTFTELIIYFKTLEEKYGSVADGIKAELVYNIKDDEQAFKQAASRAYEIVFGIPKDKQSTQEIIDYLKAHEAFSYSKMISALMRTITPEDKKEMLFRALNEVGRPDLKKNSVFVERILSQDFTYANLKKLLEQLPAAQRPTKNNKK